jgi:hypothetical protein
MGIIEMLEEILNTDEPINEFLRELRPKVESWLGEKDKLCIVCLRPDGVFYGSALYDRLRKNGVEITSMDREGEGLEEGKLKEAKVLLVDNDIITGETYGMTMRLVKSLKKKLQIRDIKYLVFEDRTDLADFSCHRRVDIAYDRQTYCMRYNNNAENGIIKVQAHERYRIYLPVA